MAKFLFYIEPFIIRNDPIHFSSVLPNLFNALINNRTENEYFIYANKETIIKTIQQSDDYANHIILPTKQEGALFEENLIDWNNQGILFWKDLMKPSSLSEKYIKLIKDVYQRQSFDYIICWGTNYAVKQTAKELNAGFINMELGCSRPPYMDSLIADPWGVNGDSVLSQAILSDFETILESDAEADLLFSNQFDPTGYESSFAYLNSSVILNQVGKEKIAFIPLQLYDDANLLQYSSYKNVNDVIEDILPKLTAKGYTCIFKEHPATPLRYGSKYANLRAKVTALGYENVIWLTHNDHDIPNSKLYQLSDLIITVNSSAGFEALFYNKPLVVLGEAVYKIGGVFPSLNEFLSGFFNLEQYRKNIGKIRNFFLRKYLMPKEKANNASFLFPFLKFVGDMSKKNLTTKEIINKYWQYTSQ